MGVPDLTREAAVEALLVRKIRGAGGMCLKLVPVVSGLPDRLVLLPGGRIFLVELKSKTGRLRPDQVVFIRRAAALGITVHVLRGSDQVQKWIEENVG